jgi:hypothetical protein
VESRIKMNNARNEFIPRRVLFDKACNSKRFHVKILKLIMELKRRSKKELIKCEEVNELQAEFFY